jgi:hypothetical protein
MFYSYVYVNYKSFFWQNILVISSAIFLPEDVNPKKVWRFPEIIFFSLNVLKERSNFLASGHLGYFEKQNSFGNKEKHSLISS